MNEPYLPPADVLTGTISFVKRGMPNKRIRTSIAIERLERGSNYLEILLPWRNVPPYDGFVTDLERVVRAYQCVVDRRTAKEVI